MFEYEEAQFRLGWLPGEALPEVAVRMLEAGFDSQALREVAGLCRPTLRDAADQFEEALVALGRPPMTADQALACVRREALQGLASGATEIESGLRLIRDVWVADGCSAELAVFVGLEDEYFDHPEAREAIAADVREAAQALLAERVPRRAV
jgi:hypothetical protein